MGHVYGIYYLLQVIQKLHINFVAIHTLFINRLTECFKSVFPKLGYTEPQGSVKQCLGFRRTKMHNGGNTFIGDPKFVSTN